MASVGGLISGMDTATIVSQLMRLEAMPQTNLKSRLSSQERQVNALQTLNSKLANVATRAAALADAAKWSPTKATSSSEHVTVTTSGSATTGSLSLTVDRVATSHRLTSDNTVALTDAVTADGSSTVVVRNADGTERVRLDTTNGTVDGLVDAINASSDAGIRASLVKVADNSYRLHITSTATGTSSAFTLEDANGNALAIATTATAGQTAQITVGADTITSQSNTFTDLMPGVDVTVSASTPVSTTDPVSADIAVTRDSKSLADSVKAMVDAVNAALSDIDSLTAYDADTNTAGLLSGDSTLRSIRSELLSTVTSGIDGRSLAAAGIEVDRSGKLTFDSAAFTEAYDVDPNGTTGMFAGTLSFAAGAGNTGTVELHKASWRTVPGTYSVSATSTGGTIDGRPGTLSGDILNGAANSPVDGLAIRFSGDVTGTVTYKQGFAAKVEALAQRASDATSGSVTAAITGREDRIERLEDDIAAWDVRLETRRLALERQFSALEVALGKMQNQSNWLAGQLAGLPTYS